MADRPLRGCDFCPGYDDHPRHVRREGGRTGMAHMDCCAAQGCPDCIVTENENGELRGQELIDHLAKVRG